MKNLQYCSFGFCFLAILIIIPSLLFAQDSTDFNWKRYENSKFRFSIDIPDSTKFEGVDSNYLVLIIPLRQSNALLEKHELEINIFKSDSCCINPKSAFGKILQYFENDVKVVNYNNRDFYLEQDTDHAMGGAACIERYYSTCRKSDNTCLIFYFQLFYHNKYDEATEGFTEPDFNFEVELETAYRILSSLDFPDMR